MVSRFGLQIGEATHVVLLVMNERGASGIRISKVKLGADASVAAGPVGRSASAETDATVRARRHPSSSSGDDFDTGFPDSKA